MSESAAELRDRTFAELLQLGFRVAPSLQFPDSNPPCRPVEEIAARLLALKALFCYVAAPADAVPTAEIQQNVDRNRLRDWMTPDETEILDGEREAVQDEHGSTCGWWLENMWPLAWAIGMEPAPDLTGGMISSEMIDRILGEGTSRLAEPMSVLVNRSQLRPLADIVALEYRFYCGHNAVRSAQLGHATVPAGFHPVADGGVVHERRHALTWCLSPDDDWADTDLST